MFPLTTLNPMSILKDIGIGLLALGIGWLLGYHKGQEHKEAEYKLSISQAEAQAAERVLSQQKRIDELSAQLQVRSAKRQEADLHIAKEVTKYVPVDIPFLPGSFRLWHDASVRGEAPNDTELPNAAPVPPAILARVLRSNYGACLEDQARLAALQEIVRGIKHDSEKGQEGATN